MDPQSLIPSEHARLIRGCGVGFGAHLYLPSHIGAGPVVVVRSSGEPDCGCCGDRISAGEPALKVEYEFGAPEQAAVYLHAAHCERGAPKPVLAVQHARMSA